MMSDPKTVDRTTADELTGRPVLVIDEDRTWREANLMHQQLAAKTKYYVRYSRSPEFKAEHGRTAKSAIVRLVTEHTPGDASLRFFARVAYELSKHGLSFEHQLGEHGIPVTITPSAEELPEDEPVRLPYVPPPPSPAAPQSSEVEAATPPRAAAPQETAAPVDEAVFEESPTEEAPAEALPGGSEEELALHQAPADEPTLEDAFEEPPAPELAADPAEEEPGLELPPTTPAPSFLDLEFDTAGLDDEETTSSAEELALAEEELPPTGAMPVFDEPTALERLVDEEEFLQLEEAPAEIAEPPTAAAAASAKPGKTTYPPFFPEEEFGRAIPDMDDVEAVFERASEPAVIESGTGKRFVLDSTAQKDLPARQTDGRPSLRNAIGAAASAAIIGAAGWALLAIPAGSGASPLAVALALMVGMNVRIRGAGHTRDFRIVGIAGTVLGSLLAALLTALTLTLAGVGFDEIPGDHATGTSGLVNLVTSPGALLAAIDFYYDPIDLAFVALAAYIAFKLSAAKPG